MARAVLARTAVTRTTVTRTTVARTVVTRTAVALVAGSLFSLVPASPAGAATPALPTAAGVAACGRLGGDRSTLAKAKARRLRHARTRARTRRQKALRRARLRRDATLITRATTRLRHDSAACAARYHWAYPNPRLDQGARPFCELYAALQELNGRGARITQRTADQITAEAARQVPRATWSTEDITRGVLAQRGLRASYRRVPATVNATLAEVRHGPVTVTLAFTSGMYDTDRTGHWVTRGARTGLDHGVVLVGYDPRNQHVLLLNQWGRGWGVDGGMWLTRAEYARLLTGATVWTLG